MKQEKLKPCPFCGQNSAVVKEYHQGCEVVCENSNCPDMSDSNWKRDFAVTLWNTRPIEDRQAEQIAALLELVNLIDDCDAVKGSPKCFNSGKEYRHAVIEAIDDVRVARAKCRELGLEV